MNENLKYASYATPQVSTRWKEMSPEARFDNVVAAIESSGVDFLSDFSVLSCKEDGQVIVGFQTPLGTAERGTKLLDLESHIKKSVDEGITVWAESLGDKNSLRNLRGIEVK